MYSVVLMAALTTGGETPDIGRRGGCHGCQGGCYGGRSHGRRGGGCCGCGGGYGGCYGGGYSCGGGYGGCYGGGWSCGGGYGGMSCGGGYGGGWSCGGGVVAGCWGGAAHAPAAGCWGGAVAPGTYMAPGTYAAPAGTPKSGTKGGTKGNGDEGARLTTPAPATIVVTLPADARLTVDGTPTTSTGTQRVLVSPTLQPGKGYSYTLQATVTRDGKPVSIEEQVAVRAGQEKRVTLALPAVGVARR